MAGYGNYRHYQGSCLRHAGLPPAGAHVLDPRLALVDQLLPGIFRDAHALDIGCNRGAVSVQLASYFRGATVTGSDIDADLIQSATSHLSFAYSRTRPGSGPGSAGPPSLVVDNDDDHHRDHQAELDDDYSYFPLSAILDHGHRPSQPASVPSDDCRRQRRAPSPCQDQHPGNGGGGGDDYDDGGSGGGGGESPTLPHAPFPHNVCFVVEDWALTPPGDVKVDVILALSVVKWIHLQHLDAGLQKFFRKCGRCLVPAGHLIIEVQPWKSYERAAQKDRSSSMSSSSSSPSLDANLARLRLKPEDFETLARGEGMELVEVSEVLPRRIEIYRKL